MNSNNRYNRQTKLAGFGKKRQEMLANSKVLVIGLGGLGIPVIQYLNAMGIGTLGIVENDNIEIHNLQRQVIYLENDIGKKKIAVAKDLLKKQNSETKIISFDAYFSKKNALEIIEKFDLVVDASDNFSTRYLINDACIILNKVFIYGAIYGFEGQISVFNYKNGPTYRCLFPKMPNSDEVPSCDVNGVLGILPGIVGSNQALEAIKILTDLEEVMSGKLWLFDALKQTINKINFKQNPKNKEITQLKPSYEEILCDAEKSISCENFLKIQKKQNYILIDVRDKEEFDSYNIDDSLNIPLADIENSFNPPFHNQQVYLICKSGKRSFEAVEIFNRRYPKTKFKSIIGGLDKFKMLCH